MNLYVIGAVTGKENDNREEFLRVADSLAEKHDSICIPHDLIDEFDPYAPLWEFCMQRSLAYIIKEWDLFNEPPQFGIAMLDDWQDSKGANIEHDLAVSLGIPCKPWREWL